MVTMKGMGKSDSVRKKEETASGLRTGRGDQYME